MSQDARAPCREIAALTTRMAKGDEAAWREFYDAYFDRLLRYLIVAANGREEAAREALQGTLVRAVRHMRRFESEEGFWSWLTVLARSSVVDERRKRTRYAALLDRFLARHRTEPFSHAGSGSDADERLLGILEKHLARLGDEERELLERKYFSKIPVREIAAAAGATEKMVESRMGRIRRKLRDLIVAELKDET
jgi:RNA polymerase sigma-70 factor, ECF subfamily